MAGAVVANGCRRGGKVRDARQRVPTEYHQRIWWTRPKKGQSSGVVARPARPQRIPASAVFATMPCDVRRSCVQGELRRGVAEMQEKGLLGVLLHMLMQIMHGGVIEVIGDVVVRSWQDRLSAFVELFRGEVVSAGASAVKAVKTTLQRMSETFPMAGDSDLPLAHEVGAVACLRVKGDLSAAEPFTRKALELRERTLGSKHPDTLVSVANLGMLHRARGDLAGAEPLAARAAREFLAQLGAEHSHTKFAQRLLTDIQRDRAAKSPGK